MDPAETDSGSDYTDSSDYEDEELTFENEEEDEQEEIEKFINMINSSQKPVQFEGLVGIRRLCSIDDFPLTQKVIDSGILPKILEIMTWEHESHFQIESTCCVLNICAGEAKFSDCIIELGGLDIIINLLESPLSDIVEQAVWAIWNIAGASFKHRDICLQKDCLSKLLQTLEKFPTHDRIIKTALNAMSDLYKGKPYPQWEKVLPALPVIHKHISEVYSQENLVNALWCLAYVSDEKIQEVLDQGCLPFLIQHLCDGRDYIVAPSLRALASIVAGNDDQTNEVLSHPEFLPKIFEITSHPKKVLRKEAFWVISNIAAGTPEQIEMIIENDNSMQRLKTAVAEEPLETAREAAFGITNIFSQATSEQLNHIIEKHGFLRSLAHILKDSEDVLKRNVLEAIQRVLETEAESQEKDSWMKEIKRAGLVEIIRDLANKGDFSSNVDLILSYFSIENPEESGEKIENKKNLENNGRQE